MLLSLNKYFFRIGYISLEKKELELELDWKCDFFFLLAAGFGNFDGIGYKIEFFGNI